MPSILLAAGLLAGLALGTFLWQRRAFRAQQQERLQPFEVDFYRKRHRRRVQISLLLAVVAISMTIGSWLERNPLVFGFIWLGVLLLLTWILILALLDYWHSQQYFDRLRVAQLAEQAALQRELARRRDANPSAD